MNEIKDYQEFWDRRWGVDKKRGGVSKYQTVDALYEERNKRDISRLLEAISWTGKGASPFHCGLEVGAGSGRMTPFMLSQCENLVCVDGSAEATKYRREDFPEIPHHVMLIKDMPKNLPIGTFDFAMTLTVVQHIHDLLEWEASMKAIQAMLRPGGIYVMHEDVSAFIQRREASPHMNTCSPEDYIEVLDECELVKSAVLYYEPSNEYDLLAAWRKK